MINSNLVFSAILIAIISYLLGSVNFSIKLSRKNEKEYINHLFSAVCV